MEAAQAEGEAARGCRGVSAPHEEVPPREQGLSHGLAPEGEGKASLLVRKTHPLWARHPVQRHAVFSVLLMRVVRKGMVTLMTICELTHHYCSCFSRYPRAKGCLSFPGIHQHITIIPRNFLGPSSQCLQPHLIAIFSRQHISDTTWWHRETRVTQHLLQEVKNGVRDRVCESR